MQPPYKYRALVTNVVDGDTIDARVDLGFTVSVDIRFRLNGLDTPELNSPNSDIRDKANRAKQFVIDHVLSKDVLIKSYKTDKYGRWLVDVFLDENTTLNQRLIEVDLAVPYNGGAK